MLERSTGIAGVTKATSVPEVITKEQYLLRRHLIHDQYLEYEDNFDLEDKKTTYLPQCSCLGAKPRASSRIQNPERANGVLSYFSLTDEGVAAESPKDQG
ncbi:hypothetical protein Tco_0758225 [Tanacetum coccineum]